MVLMVDSILGLGGLRAKLMPVSVAHVDQKAC